ncbi:MAG: radical SAM protein [Bacteroidota bacterium]
MVKFTSKSIKSILNVKKNIDGWFWDKYSLNPYNGCSFGCIYCDARSSHYHMPTDFENNILVKDNPHLHLDKRISRARTLLPDVVGIGGVTDAYQPAEKLYKNTRNSLEVLQKHRYPIHLATKSTLVKRDLDIIQSIAEDTWATVSVSISSSKKEISDFLDFRSPAPEKRFNLIESIKRHSDKIQVGVLYLPMVPYLNDSTEGMQDMIKRSIDSGADYLLFGGLTMHDTQSKWFLNRVKEEFPDLIPKYQSLFHFKFDEIDIGYKGLPSTPKDYLKATESKLQELCLKHRLPIRMKRFIPEDYRKWNYVVAEKLLNERYFCHLEGKNNQELFWAAFNIHNLKESIKTMSERGHLSTIRNVKGSILKQIEAYLA